MQLYKRLNQIHTNIGVFYEDYFLKIHIQF